MSELKFLQKRIEELEKRSESLERMLFEQASKHYQLKYDQHCSDILLHMILNSAAQDHHVNLFAVKKALVEKQQNWHCELLPWRAFQKAIELLSAFPPFPSEDDDEPA